MTRPFALHSTETALETALSELVSEFSIEVLPQDASKIFDFRDHLPEGTRVYVPVTSGRTNGVVQTAERLALQGMKPVPHVAARRIASEAALTDFVRALSAVGAKQILLVGGDSENPAGPFSSSMDVLRTGLLEDHGIDEFGVAAHPEGHPAVSAPDLQAALADKHRYARANKLAMHVTTQFLFQIAPLIDWHRDTLCGTAPGVPVDVGMPGLATTTTLMRFARDCGVRTSMAMLARNPARALKLATPFSPDEALIALAQARASGHASQVRSIHFYPFGSFQRTSAWARSLAAGCFRIDRHDWSLETW